MIVKKVEDFQIRKAFDSLLCECIGDTWCLNKPDHSYSNVGKILKEIKHGGRYWWMCCGWQQILKKSQHPNKKVLRNVVAAVLPMMIKRVLGPQRSSCVEIRLFWNCWTISKKAWCIIVHVQLHIKPTTMCKNKANHHAWICYKPNASSRQQW